MCVKPGDADCLLAFLYLLSPARHIESRSEWQRRLVPTIWRQRAPHLQLGKFLISLLAMNLVFKALSHPARRQIISMLQKGPLTSGEIAAAFDMAWPSVTGHLAALKEADLVDTQRDGNTIRYRLNISAAEEAVGFLVEILQSAKPSKRVTRATFPRRKPA